MNVLLDVFILILPGGFSKGIYEIVLIVASHPLSCSEEGVTHCVPAFNLFEKNNRHFGAGYAIPLAFFIAFIASSEGTSTVVFTSLR